VDRRGDARQHGGRRGAAEVEVHGGARLADEGRRGAVGAACLERDLEPPPAEAPLEAALAATPLHVLADRARSDVLKIREYSHDLAVHFRDINTEWIEAMFRLEDTDRRVLEDPQASIIDTGGTILFVEAGGLGVIGTCALQKTGENSVELTKMAVREAARGLKAGEFLLAAMIDRARSMKADPLYLLTSSRCAPAIHLYEKLGFRHDADIMARYGARYARCDVAMRYVEPGADQQRQ
jgi:GNAT superfamily N-acetyltransferase